VVEDGPCGLALVPTLLKQVAPSLASAHLAAQLPEVSPGALCSLLPPLQDPHYLTLFQMVPWTQA
jgi:hypothetical protein